MSWLQSIDTWQRYQCWYNKYGSKIVPDECIHKFFGISYLIQAHLQCEICEIHNNFKNHKLLIMLRKKKRKNENYLQSCQNSLNGVFFFSSSMLIGKITDKAKPPVRVGRKATGLWTSGVEPASGHCPSWPVSQRVCGRTTLAQKEINFEDSRVAEANGYPGVLIA